MNNVAAMLFDWGGTLCSTEREAETFVSCAAAACRAAEESGICLSEGAAARLHDLFRQTHRRPEPADEHPEMRIEPVVASWLTDEGIISVPEATAKCIGRAFWEAWCGSLHLIGDADRVLAELRSRGYRLGLVSNVATPPDICVRELGRLRLRDSLEVLAFSSEVGHRKPHPAIYRSAMDRLNHDGREVEPGWILFVGDSPEYDVQVPASMGMKTALLPDVSGLWDPGHHAKVQPDLRIKSVADLLEVLTGP